MNNRISGLYIYLLHRLQSFPPTDGERRPSLSGESRARGPRARPHSPLARCPSPASPPPSRQPQGEERPGLATAGGRLGPPCAPAAAPPSPLFTVGDEPLHRQRGGAGSNGLAVRLLTLLPCQPPPETPTLPGPGPVSFGSVPSLFPTALLLHLGNQEKRPRLVAGPLGGAQLVPVQTPFSQSAFPKVAGPCP